MTQIGGVKNYNNLALKSLHPLCDKFGSWSKLKNIAHPPHCRNIEVSEELIVSIVRCVEACMDAETNGNSSRWCPFPSSHLHT